MDHPKDREKPDKGAPVVGTSRRSFLKGMGLAAGAAAVLPSMGEAQESTPRMNPGADYFGKEKHTLQLKINGQLKEFHVETRTTLLEALRDHAGLTGSKEVCDRGACGCCSVLLDGVAVTSCMMLAMDAFGHEITTIEGIASDARFKNLIDGFCENDGAQCGFCIPGFVVGAASLLHHNPKPTADEVREGLGGNICRCGTYSKIFDSVSAAITKGGVK